MFYFEILDFLCTTYLYIPGVILYYNFNSKSISQHFLTDF